MRHRIIKSITVCVVGMQLINSIGFAYSHSSSSITHGVQQQSANIDWSQTYRNLMVKKLSSTIQSPLTTKDSE